MRWLTAVVRRPSSLAHLLCSEAQVLRELLLCAATCAPTCVHGLHHREDRFVLNGGRVVRRGGGDLLLQCQLVFHHVNPSPAFALRLAPGRRHCEAGDFRAHGPEATSSSHVDCRLHRDAAHTTGPCTGADADDVHRHAMDGLHDGKGLVVGRGALSLGEVVASGVADLCHGAPADGATRKAEGKAEGCLRLHLRVGRGVVALTRRSEESGAGRIHQDEVQLLQLMRAEAVAVPRTIDLRSVDLIVLVAVLLQDGTIAQHARAVDVS
mmetsp:Transcript_15211/g.31886  ORF Transcript_15211/g.31886 Transcript_15211/m.31886 type:complete len:267 (+) Transcript_15211:68-868(+)